MDRKKKLIVFLCIAGIGFILDMGSKLWAQNALTQDYLDPSKVSPFTFRLTLAFNHGAAFGFLSDVASGRWILIIVGTLAMYFIYYLYKRPESNHRLYLVGLALVAGGAMGNLVDRIIFGRVTDFVQMWLFPSIRITWPWPTYNVADVLLLGGVGCLLIFSFLPEGRNMAGKGDSPTPKKSGAPRK